MQAGGGGGNCGVSANEYSCAHGAKINFGDLTLFNFIFNLWFWAGRAALWVRNDYSDFDFLIHLDPTLKLGQVKKSVT